MKTRFYNLLFAVALLFATVFQAKAQTPPTTSTAGNEVWYYIQCLPRSTDLNAKWLTGGADGVVVTNQLISTTDDAQQWKVIDNAGGIALVNKLGTYLNSDKLYDAVATSIIPCVTAAPATALKLWPYVDQTTTATGIPGGFYLVNADATTPITNVANTSLTFQFYSAGTGSNFRPINYGTNAPNINSAIVFLTAKDILLQAITIATTGYNNSSEGLNPGQFSPDDRDALLSSIEAAQITADNASATKTEIFTATTELNTIYTQFKNLVILPEVSTANSDVWYYIQGTRPINTYMTAPAAGVGTQVKDLPVIPDISQLWKLVSNGDGFALQNKGSLEYLQTDFATGTNLNTQVSMPTSALRFITSNETSNKASRFWIENSASSTPAYRLHAGASGNGWGLMNWTGNANDNCTWLFLSEDDVFRTELINTKIAAHDLYNSTKEGAEFGEYSAANRTALNTVLTTEEAKDVATMTQEELKASNQTIKDAITAYTCNSDVKALVSVTKIKWFRFINVARLGKGMSSNGRVENDKFTFELKDVNSDAQLFKLELNGNQTAVANIINKANSLYVGADGTMLAAPTADVEFAINQLDGFSFEMRPTGNSPLHAQETGSHIVNWESGAGSASAWKFEFVKEEAISDFTKIYLDSRVKARTNYNTLLPIVGTEFSQIPATTLNAYNVAVTAEEAKDVLLMTQDDLLAGVLNLEAASKALATNTVYNTDLNLLVSSDPIAKPKWFRLVNAASAVYANGKAMSSNGRLEAEKFTFEDKDVSSDNQLFRFELNTATTKVLNIVNKANGLYLAYNGAMQKASTPNTEFAITQLAGGRSFLINPFVSGVDSIPLHAAASGLEILNYAGIAGSASSWNIEFVRNDIAGLRNLNSFDYVIHNNNGIITIDGVEKFEVYSITGQKQNNKTVLKAGVYVVRVNNYNQKVVLK